MDRRKFLERVSELAKGAVAGITLSKVQIAAVAASLATVMCEKEKPVNPINNYSINNSDNGSSIVSSDCVPVKNVCCPTGASGK